MAQHIYGEESNMFTNSVGECIRISIGATHEETRQMLQKVLSEQHSQAAELLASEVHRVIKLDDDEKLHDIPIDELTPYSNLGIWIDPIGKAHV